MTHSAPGSTTPRLCCIFCQTIGLICTYPYNMATTLHCGRTAATCIKEHPKEKEETSRCSNTTEQSDSDRFKILYCYNYKSKPQLCKGIQEGHMLQLQIQTATVQRHTRGADVQMTHATLTHICMMVSTELTTNTIIIFLNIFRGIPLCPHGLKHSRPRSIGLIPSLSPHTKPRQVQQNMDMMVQISGRTHPHIADDLPMPKACKEVFHPCAIETMHTIRFLLVVTQSLATKIWNNSMDVLPDPSPEILLLSFVVPNGVLHPLVCFSAFLVHARLHAPTHSAASIQTAVTALLHCSAIPRRRQTALWLCLSTRCCVWYSSHNCTW